MSNAKIGKGAITSRNVRGNDSLKIPSRTEIPVGVSQTGHAYTDGAMTRNPLSMNFIAENKIKAIFCKIFFQNPHRLFWNGPGHRVECRIFAGAGASVIGRPVGATQAGIPEGEGSK